MRAITLVVGVAILAVLSVIAVDLHRMANYLEPGSTIKWLATDLEKSFPVKPTPVTHETERQEVERRAREAVAAQETARASERKRKEVSDRIKELQAQPDSSR